MVETQITANPSARAIFSQLYTLCPYDFAFFDLFFLKTYLLLHTPVFSISKSQSVKSPHGFVMTHPDALPKRVFPRSAWRPSQIHKKGRKK